MAAEIPYACNVGRGAKGRPVIYWKGLLSSILLAATVFAGPVAASSEDEKLYRSIGRVIAIEDSRLSEEALAPLEVGKSWSAIFESEYKKNIRSLPVKKRIIFFWSVMMHTLLDGEAHHDFVVVVSKDCRKEFMDTLKKFIDESRRVGPSNREVDRAGTVYSSLEQMPSPKTGN